MNLGFLVWILLVIRQLVSDMFSLPFALSRRHRPKVDREHESTEDLEVQKQREMQDHLKEMTR